SLAMIAPGTCSRVVAQAAPRGECKSIRSTKKRPVVSTQPAPIQVPFRRGRLSLECTNGVLLMRLARLFAAFALVAGTAAPALASPAGVWELETKDTRFQLEMCGDGTKLCGQLV